MLFVLGLDGATFDLLNPWMAEGYLPTLASLAQNGATSELTSTLPPVTSPAWPSFMTGKLPAQHGVFDFFRRVPGREPHHTELINSTHIQSALFWDYLSEAGKTVGILNVPATHPPRPVNGYLIPGLLSPDQGATTYPPDLCDPYITELGAYRLTPDLLYRPGNEASFIQQLHDITELQFRYAKRLWHDQPTDFFMLHILATDIIQHKLWKHMDASHPWHEPDTPYKNAIRDLYVAIDRWLAELMEGFPAGATTLIISDHGFGPQHQTANLNNLFLAQGLMTLKPSLSRHLRQLAWRNALTTKLGQRLWRRERLLDFTDVDWTQTYAYSLGHMGQIYLNLVGREPNGIVPLNDYEQLCQQISQALHTLSLPLQIHLNPTPTSAPDIQVVLDEYRTLAYPMFTGDGKIITEQFLGDSGHHRMNGVLLAHGEGIRPGQSYPPANLTDLAPTILHLLQTPIPTDLDGQILNHLLTTSHPITHRPPLPMSTPTPHPISSQDEDEITQRLQALGYLDQ